MRTTIPTALLSVAALLLVACGGDGEPATTEAEATETPEATEEATEHAAEVAEDAPEDEAPAETAEEQPEAVGTAYPIDVEGCGVAYTYDAAPERIVATDTSALETLIDLGLGDRVVGWFGSQDFVAEERADEAAGIEHLGAAFPYPSLEAVVASDPDLVFTYGLSEETGLTAERLAEEDIAMYSFVEACPGFEGTMSLEVFYEQVQELGDIFDIRTDADALVEGWRDEVAAAHVDADVTVFLQGSFNVEEPFTIGHDALVHDIIESAGGTNAFGDVDEGFFAPTWEDVVAREPQLIAANADALEDFAAYARSNPALAEIPAIVNDNLVGLDYIQRVPGPQIIDGVALMAAAIEATDG